MRDDEAQLRAELAQPLGRLVDRLDAVVQVEGLALTCVFAAERRLDKLLVVFAHEGTDRAAALRGGLDHGDVAQARERHVQRAWDRRRGQAENVDLEAELTQELLLRDAETLLLVDDDQAELLRDHVAREHPVGTDQYVDLALRVVGKHALHIGRRPEAGDHLDADRKVAVTLAESVPVLLGEHGRRHEHQRLLAVDGDSEGGPNGDLRLAEAHVAADEPVHRPRRLQVLLDRLDRALLVLGLPVRELGLESLQPLVPQVEGLTLGLLAAGVERKQLACELPQAGAGAALQVLPGLAAKLGERGRARIRPDVPGYLADLLVRDVEAVLAPEGEQQVVAGDAGDLLRLEGLQAADTVILVDDVVARAQVGEALEGAAQPRVRSWRTLPEDLGVREQDEPELTPDEAAARGRAASAGRCASKENGWLAGSGSSSVEPARFGSAFSSSSATARTSSGSQTRSGAPANGGTRSAGTVRKTSSSSGRVGSLRSGRRSAAG